MSLLKQACGDEGFVVDVPDDLLLAGVVLHDVLSACVCFRRVFGLPGTCNRRSVSVVRGGGHPIMWSDLGPSSKLEDRTEAALDPQDVAVAINAGQAIGCMVIAVPWRSRKGVA